MEEVLSALVAIKKELDEQRLEIRDTGKNVTEQESETSYASLERNIINWIEQYFNIKLTYSDIQEVKRIGKKSQRPRPIVVIFSTLGTKIKILKHKEALKDTPYYFKEDYPKQVLQKRRELQEQVKMEREKGNIVKIKYDKLVILKPNQKRQLHTSPTNDSQAQSDASSNVNKKIKMLKTHSSVRRSNSVSESVLKPSMLNFLVNKKVSNTTPEQDIQNKEKNL
ncbi:unnamed protein product [Euphydryas editha]|uniref:Endonuclease-reverse transcriptase n=1 Tax=Euphydryas editha TaxID=104508 RepID=A0AAU9TNB4_EUPED|nr:unnamed protein product [Euphydryas editha]